MNPPRSRPANAALEAELQRTQHHLSELIDEVVHSEKVAEAAEREVEARKRYTAVLEESLTNLLVYVSNVERKILLPAVGDLDLYLASSKFLSDPKMHRTVALAKASEGLALVPEARRQKLLDLLTKPLSETSHADIAVAREGALSGDGGHGSLPLEEAVVLIGQLMRNQEELQLLVTDTRQRYRQFNRETNAPGASTLSSAAGSTNDTGSASTSELAELRATLDTLKRERELLLRKANETVTYEELQRSYHAEREQLQKRIASLETRLKQDDGSRVEVANRFETLQRALDQSYQEKLLLQQEIEKLRLEIAKQSPAQVSLSNDKELHSMRMEMDRIVRLHSANVTELESTIASLRIDLANAQATASIQTRQQLQHLHDENEKLRKSLTELQMRTASSPSAHGRQGLGIGESSLDGKIKAFEITINGLNSELSAMEKKIVSSEARFLEERARLEMMHERERQQYQDEREECDQLVLKMTNELESLVRENTALKMKLRSSGIY
jgi:hypothetical protein